MIRKVIEKVRKEHKKLLRYLLAGIVATLTGMGTLYLFTDIFNIWYIYSAVISYIISFVVSFVLQKFWTFQDTSCKRMKKQAITYFCIGVINLGFNTLGMYLLVDRYNIMYLLAQLIMSAAIALESFFIYNYLIFKKRKEKIYETDCQENPIEF